MSGKELNPYESPAIPEEAKSPANEAQGIILRFPVDARDQWVSAANISVPVPAWFYWTLPIWLIVMGMIVIGGVANYGPLGAIGAIFVCFSILSAIQWFRHRGVKLQQLRRLQAHPVLGAIGDWKLIANRDDLIVETSGGTQTFSRSTTPIQMLEGVDLVIWFEGSFPITIPEHGQYAKGCRVLRYWLIKTAPT